MTQDEVSEFLNTISSLDLSDPQQLQAAVQLILRLPADPPGVVKSRAAEAWVVIESYDNAYRNQRPEWVEIGAPDSEFDAALVMPAEQVGAYGVPLRTREGDEIVNWEAIVGDRRVAPRYFEGYSRQPGRFGFNNEEQIARVQLQMEEAGLLQPGSYAIGVWDATTAGRSNTEGWRSVLAFANMNGLEWDDAFDRMYDAGIDAKARGLSMDLSRLNRQPFFADPTTLRSRTRNFLLEMGRLPTQISDEELDSLTEQAMYGAQAARRTTIESQIQQRLGGAVGPDGELLPTTTRGDEFEMDPVAYFDRELEKLTAREMEARTEQQISERGSRDFQSIIAGFGSGLGG